MTSSITAMGNFLTARSTSGTRPWIGPLLQPVAVINYPNEHAYTRVTEFKHLTGQAHSKTSLVYEFPCDERRSLLSGSPPENATLYKQV